MDRIFSPLVTCSHSTSFAQTLDILNQKQLSCLICVGLLNPERIPCGQTYCKICIGDWDQDDQKNPYHICFQCRETYTPRHALDTNAKFDEVVEKIEKTGLQADDTDSGNIAIYSKSYTEAILRKHTEEILSEHMLRNPHLVSKKKEKMGGTKKTQSPAPSSSGQTVEKQDLKEFQDPEPGKTQELYAQMDYILERVNQNNFKQSMKAISEFTINTEARLKGIVHLIYERALAQPACSVIYANICRCLMGLKVPTAAKPGVTVNFRKLLLNRVQIGFENMARNSREILQQKPEMVDTITKEEERQRLREKLEEAKTEGRRKSLGNIKLMCELFKLKMLTECVMHDVIVNLLRNQDDDSLEGLCTLLYTVGNNLDFEKARPRMDQYYNQIVKILQNRTRSPRIRYMLQDVLDLRKKETPSQSQLVKKMEKTRLEADNDAEKHTRPGDTEPVLRPHYKSLAMKNQKLFSTSIPLQENTCPHHDDTLKAEDSAAARGATKKKKARLPLKTCQQIILEREEVIQKLRQEVESLKCLSQATMEDSERFFTKLIETRCSEVREVIQAKEKEMVSEAERLLQTLEQELDELQRTETEGRHLPHIEAYPHFLQTLPRITKAFKEVRTYASEMHQQFEDSSKLQFVEFSNSVEESLGPYTISSLCTIKQAVEENDLEDFVDLETVKTEEMYEQMDNILGSLTTKNFHQSMKVVSAFTVDTEGKLKGIIDAIYERAILNPTSAEVYAKVCHHHQLLGLKIPGVTVNFRKLLLNQCQKGFEKDNSKILKEKQRELDATTEEEDRQRLREELEEAKAEGRRELLGNVTFVCELFKLKLMTEGFVDYCVAKLIKDEDDDSLEGLCTILFTIGKDLDSEKNQPRMDEHYTQINLIKERRRTSPRIRYMLHDVLDLRTLHLGNEQNEDH